MAIEYASKSKGKYATREGLFQAYLNRVGLTYGNWARRQSLDAESRSLELAYQKLKAKYA